MSLLVVRAQEIRKLLSMSDCIDVMDQAMRAASDGSVNMPPRIIAPVGDGADFFILMPGALREPTTYGAKVVSLLPGNPSTGHPAVQGFVTLFDGSNGAPVAILDGAEITRIRTAAASALATRQLARSAACTHGIIGAGVQAEAHLEAIACVRDIEKICVWARDFKKAQAFADQHSGQCNIHAVASPADAAVCDIVSVVTNSAEPVLQGAWLSPGSHINLVGAHEAHDREADSDAVSSASIYVDSRKSALSEAGDLLIPISEGRITVEDIIGEIGEVLLGSADGRANEEQITLYKSLGIFAQDLFAADYILQLARDRGTGQAVDFP